MSQNELDNFLRQKELEFEVPFEEKYWEQARELIDRERGVRTVAWWNNANVRLSALAVLLGIVAVWYAATNKSVNESASVANTTEHAAATPYFEEKPKTDNRVVTEGSGNNDASTVTKVSSFSSNSVNVLTSSNNEANHSTSASASKRLAGNASNATTISVNTSTKASSFDGAASSAATTRVRVNKNSVATKLAADPKSVKANNAVVTARKTTFKSSSTTNFLSTQNLQNTRSDISVIHVRKAPFISYRLDNEIPVFEEMTPNDPSLLKFYGLYYKSAGATSKKIRDFKRGAQYPQLGIAAVGGVNVFNQIKNLGDTNIYVGVNPYLGMRACFQWNPMMSVCVQPMFVQRGGVRVHSLPSGGLVNGVTPEYRHLYYLQIPISIGFKVSKKNTISAGGGVSIPVAAGYKMYNIETAKSSGKYHVAEGFNGAKDYFGTLGYQFRFNRKIAIQTAFSYGFTNITPTGMGAGANHNLQTSLGVTYSLYQEKIHLR